MKQQPNQKPPTLFEQYQFAKWLTQFPALTLMVLLRNDIGYRLLDPLRVVGTFGILAAAGILLMPGNPPYHPLGLLIFAVIGFLSAVVQRMKRWLEIRRGVRKHSFYIGTSPFEFRWLPAACKKNRRMARFFDPLFSLAVGLAILPFSTALAVYLAFAAFSLRAYEHQTWDREEQYDLDTMDSMIEAEIQGQVAQAQQEKAKSAPPSNPVSTGLGEDVRESIKRRKP